MSKMITRGSVTGTELSGAQLKAALTGMVDALTTAGLHSGSRSTINADTTLTVDQCGMVLVDCTSGNVALTLPTSGDTTDDAVFLICRLDNTGNTLSYVRGGSDTVEGSSSPGTIAGRGIIGLQMPADGTDWKVFSRTGGTQAGARTAISAAASGANGDITSLGGLTTPITVAQGGDGIQTIPTPTFNAGAMTIPATSYTLDFHSPTLGSGAVSRVIDTADALIVPSGATLGLTSGVQSDLILLVLNNGGVLEQAIVNAAGAVDISETGVISTTAIDTASDIANVVYSTTAHSNLPYRVVGMYRSTQTTAGTWAQAMSLILGAGGNKLLKSAASTVRLNTANGYGSTNTLIRRFTNVVTNQGSDITYADSATLGASFTINTPGVYSISHSDAGTGYAGISRNTTQPTTAISSITNAAECLAIGNVSSFGNASWTGYLAAGDVIRAHHNNANAGGTTPVQFTIVRVS